MEFSGGALIWKFSAFAMVYFRWDVLRGMVNSEAWETAALLSQPLNSFVVVVVVFAVVGRGAGILFLFHEATSSR